MTVRGSCVVRCGVLGAIASLSVSVGIPTGDVGMATAGGVDVEQPLARSSAHGARRSSKRLIVGEIVFATAALLSSRRSVQIGRASCRERGEIEVVGVSIKQK